MTAMWGYRVQRTTMRRAPFVCSRCGVDRLGTEFEPQRWFTLFGRRIVPLATFDRVVECDTCGHRSDVGAWEIPTTEMLAVLLEEATRTAAASVVRAGTRAGHPVDPAILEAAVTVVRDADDSYDERRLRDDLVDLGDGDPTARLVGLVAELTAHGKQGLLRRMTTIATVDGPVTAAERDALTVIGRGLGMAEPHIHGVLAVAALRPEPV
jgi:hypothetical protein